MTQTEALRQRLADEADLCRNDGADDIAALLDEARAALAARSVPSGEPVAWRYRERVNDEYDTTWILTKYEPPDGPRIIAREPLYAAPQPAPAGWRLVPETPTPGVLMSMAIRYDHALGMPGYYDQPMLQSTVSHQQRLQSTISTMRQLYEEATGAGFYSNEREADYAALAAAPTAPGA